MFEPPSTRSGRRLVFMFGRTELERTIRDGVRNIEKEAEANAYAQIADLYEAAERLVTAMSASNHATTGIHAGEVAEAMNEMKRLLNGGPT